MSKLTLLLPPEFVEFCEHREVDPKEVLKGFIADLAGIQNWAYPNPAEGRFPRPNDGYQSNGSDERRMAFEYFQRTPLGWRRE